MNTLSQPAPIKKVKVTLDTGEEVILNRDDVVLYQQKHKDAIFTRIETYVPSEKKVIKSE